MEKRLLTDPKLRATSASVDGSGEDNSEQSDEQTSAQPKQPNTVEGYALLFNEPSKDLGGFQEVINPNALDGLDLSKVIMLDQHDFSKPLASVEGGTLKLDVDDKGLHFTAILDDNVSYAKDTYRRS